MGVFEYVGNGNEDENTFFSLSGEYLEAAQILHNASPVILKYESVKYFLLGHAAELSLKSYLCHKEIDIKDLRRIGHDLSSLLDEGKKFGLTNLSAIRELSSTYKNKKLEYRQNRRETFPSIDNLIEEITELRSITFDHLFNI